MSLSFGYVVHVMKQENTYVYNTRPDQVQSILKTQALTIVAVMGAIVASHVRREQATGRREDFPVYIDIDTGWKVEHIHLVCVSSLELWYMQQLCYVFERDPCPKPRHHFEEVLQQNQI